MIWSVEENLDLDEKTNGFSVKRFKLQTSLPTKTAIMEWWNTLSIDPYIICESIWCYGPNELQGHCSAFIFWQIMKVDIVTFQTMHHTVKSEE